MKIHVLQHKLVYSNFHGEKCENDLLVIDVESENTNRVLILFDENYRITEDIINMAYLNALLIIEQQTYDDKILQEFLGIDSRHDSFRMIASTGSYWQDARIFLNVSRFNYHYDVYNCAKQEVALIEFIRDYFYKHDLLWKD